MKRKLSNADILTIILLALSIVEIVISAVWGIVPWYIMLLCQALNFIGILAACYSYSFASIRNGAYSLWNRENRENVDDAPSSCGVVLVKATGYFILIAVAVVYLVYGIELLRI